MTLRTDRFNGQYLSQPFAKTRYEVLDSVVSPPSLQCLIFSSETQQRNIFGLVYAMKVYKGSRVMTPLILDLGNR